MPAVNGSRHGPDDVVLTGLSGRLPESDTIDEFADQLFAGVDLVTADDRRWTPGLHGLPERNGKLKDLAHFDASFFGVHGKQAHLMDPQLRLLLELVHEAVVDAGVCPAELRGSNTGVFVGVSNSETEEKWTEDPDKINGYALTGCCRAMFPNRISYTFDLHGPSYAVDTACSSSMFALAQAARAIREGQCDAAVVAGCNLCLKPANSLNFHRLSMLSPEGRCAAFDASGRGYVRSEAAVAVLLQRRAAARRVYCAVRAARMNTDGSKEQGITFPSGAMQRRLAADTFAEAGLRPRDVAYVEAHGTGTKVGDPQEVNAIADLFCPGRSKPLLLGSVKSNMGHSEPASGLCSIAKVVLAMERGALPPNLHYETPNPDIPALSDGRIQVVDRVTPWEGGVVAVNSFGFGGANAHVVLESDAGPLPGDDVTYAVPRLICISGRTEESVRSLLGAAAAHPRRGGLHALLAAAHAAPLPGLAQRGFLLLRPSSAEPLLHVQECSGEPRPLWFVFSGMGSQYSGMARELAALPAAAASLARCGAALAPHGLDLRALLCDAPEAAFDDVVNSFVSIAAVQVALVDVLRELGLTPDGIVGHSVGEVGCAYADGSLSAEQAVLCAYWRGRSIVDAALAPAAMAAVGLSWEQAAAQCPPDVVPACHNSADSVTVSGPIPSIEAFVEQLSAKGIFARRVKSSGVAFHSKYIAAAAPLLKQSLQKVIDKPKPRSSKWISSSLPKDQWNSDIAKLSDASYHVNNLLSPVRFCTALQEVPERALVLELAPHALLQAVLRRALPRAAVVGLLRRDAPRPLEQLLAALGHAHCAGAAPAVERLYPAPAWPVPRGTPGLAGRLRWDHAADWSVAHFGAAPPADTVFELDLARDADAYLAGHNIDGRVLFPATGYLTLIWRTIAKMHNKKFEETAVVIEDVQFKRATIMSKDTPTKFLVSVLEGSGEFVICEGGAVAVSGTVRIAERPSHERLAELEPAEPEPEPAAADDDGPLEPLPLLTDDVYKELRLRGYHYDGPFKGIKASDPRGNEGELAWDGNWISFIDTMLQFGIIGTDTRELYLPTRLQRVLIDPATQPAPGQDVPVRMRRDIDVTAAGGVELRGLKTSLAPRRLNPQAAPKLERYTFVPLDSAAPTCNDPVSAKRDALTVCLQVVRENIGLLKLKVTEAAYGRPAEALLTPTVMQILEGEPQVRVDASVVVESAAAYKSLDELGVKLLVKDAGSADADSDCHCVLGSDVLARGGGALAALAGWAAPGALLLLEEAAAVLREPGLDALLARAGLALAARQPAAAAVYLLLRRDAPPPPPALLMEIGADDNYDWVLGLRDAMLAAEGKDARIYLWTRAPTSGILGLATCLRGEAGGKALRVYYLPEAKEPFTVDGAAYKRQVRLDLCMNVLKNDVWGTMRHLGLADGEVALPVEHAYVNTITRGDLSSLRWIESSLRWAGAAPLPPGAELCRVYYAPLNFRDIMLATGKLPPDALPGSLAGQECILGLEFSGRGADGRRVMGMVEARGLATSVLADRGFLWDVPAAWSLEQAATVPVAYATAYYALCVRGGLRRGEALLVHAGSGGVGQAALAVALSLGCRVFTTVGTADKRAFLLQRFPGLRDDHIGNSRDASFEQLVRRRTGGRGVDVVLNSLAGEQLAASVRCLAVGGRFLEIGKLDLSNNTALGMAVFLKNTTFHGILLDALFAADARHPHKAAVVRLLADGIASGAVQPLPATVYADHQLEPAFRFMATGKHIGKVLLRVRAEEKEAKLAKSTLVSAVPRTYMHPAKTYVLVGGLGGFGLELAGWLVARGARRLVLASRGGVRSGYQAWRVRGWRGAGVRVLLAAADCSRPGAAAALLQRARRLGPVGGVFNLAAVLRDAFLENQTPDDFRAVARPKVDATRELDAATRALCPDLDYFVAFSSVSCGRGNPGQSNYGLANSSMERVCEARQADGLPALAVQWGAVGDVGLVAEHMAGDADVGGTRPQRIASCLAALGELLARPHAVAACMVLADKRRAAGQQRAALAHAVANILGVKDPAKLSQTASLADLGMDSLMGAEIKQTLERNYDVVLGVQEIRTLTFEKLRVLGGERAEPASESAAEAVAEAAPKEEAMQIKDVAELVPTKVLLELPSAAKTAARPVFLVHPIEGVGSMFKSLAARIAAPVLALQCTERAPLDSMAALAGFYVSHVRQRQPQGPYVLVGYSFGAAVAFEMALQLESAGCEVRLVLLDGSPAYVATHTTRGRKRVKRSAAADEAEGLAYFAAQLAHREPQELAARLEAAADWDARLRLLAAELRAAEGPLRAAATAFYRRLAAGDAYAPAGRLAGPVRLFTARDNYVALGEDYGLRAHCAAVAVRQLPASHRGILEAAPAADIAAAVSDLAH